MSTSDNTTNPNFKRCPRCKQEFPATAEYFISSHNRKNGITTPCKSCARNLSRLKYAANLEKERERSARYRRNNPEKRKESTKRYRETNRDRVRVISRESRRRQYWAHLDKEREKSRSYGRANPERAKVLRLRRSARKRSLPVNFSTNDWQCALDYFHGVCAYCGNPPSFFDRNTVLHADHYIPLDPDYVLLGANPGTVPINIVPACSHCNIAKRNHDPEVWIVNVFGKRRAKAIIRRIQAYFMQIEEKHDSGR